MRAFPRPPGRFVGKFRVSLSSEGPVTLEPFAYFDGREWWPVPVGFPHDGASFPWWLRWIPAFVASVMMYLAQADGFVSDFELWRSLVYPAILQALIGYPLDEIVREAAGVHDRWYFLGLRPKWKCDRAFFRVIWLRAWLDLCDGRIGCARAWVRLVQGSVWTVVVFFLGFAAWWGHRIRERRTY